jgi:hypothetical protein
LLTQPFLILLILISISVRREFFEKGLTDLMLDPEPEPNIRFFNIHRLAGHADPRNQVSSVFQCFRGRRPSADHGGKRTT